MRSREQIEKQIEGAFPPTQEIQIEILLDIREELTTLNSRIRRLL